MEAKQWRSINISLDIAIRESPRNKFIVIGDELNHVAYIPAIHPEAEKIARLIEAAPDLLAALSAMVAAAEMGMTVTPERSTWGAKAWGSFIDAEKAIAKAKG